ncbi:MAG: hypothetical protein K5696_12275 [Lachnospiraceae bacterium]|nr:hypothetical protein [Lachnospiraceae bacterium]
MNSSLHWKSFATLLMVCALLAGCGAGRTEHWAYIHAPEEEVLTLSADGSAVYKGEKVTCTKDGSFITLKDASGTESLHRYVMDGDKMIFYERSVYTRDAQVAGSGVVGVWTQDNGWSYQFTEEGTFSEESIFHGHYSVDEAGGSIRLMYDDPIEDAVLYYQLSEDGNQLTIDYPWPMVHVDKSRSS